MKNKSFLSMMNTMTRMQMALIAVLVAVFLLFAYSSAVNQQKSNLENYLAVIGADIENQISGADQCLSEIVYNNRDLELLSSKGEAERQYAAIHLAQTLKDGIRNMDGADSLVAAQPDTDLCVDARRQGIGMRQQQCLREFTMEFARSGIQTGGWSLMECDGEFYLYRALLLKHRAVIGFIHTDSLLKQIPDVLNEKNGFVLEDAGGTILSACGMAEGETASQVQGGANVRMGKSILPDTLELFACQSRHEIFGLFQSTAVFLLILLLMLMCFSVYFFLLNRRELLDPMEAMTRDMAQIRRGDLDRKVETGSDCVEFKTLVETFNMLLSEILNLKIQRYENQIALRDAEQKYIRLQLRPHYFLNAMATIVGLNRANESQKVEDYVNALSKNIRYLFSTGLHTVPAAEEVRQVENYFKMQELKYPECVLYFIDISEEAKSWQIPQMLIHTVVENEYKYAVNPADQLMVLIRLSVTRYEGEPMLLIEIEDNGKGYPDAILEAINSPEAPEQAQDGSRVGLRSIRRILELMYARQGLFQLSNVEPHGAMNRIYIPERPVHQRGGANSGEEIRI